MKRQISCFLQSAFYILAGSNHFVNPDFYAGLIPDYLPYHSAINILSGVIEILLGLGLLYPITRKFSAYGIMAMLIAFIPSHVYFIQIGSCVPDGLCTSEWVGWVRLVFVHPLFIFWAWVHRK
jgi:uncharacterized membrane protein